MLKSTTEIAGTRERILESAGELFAEHGFRQATVRDICNRAGVNVAAVNYHFRDKESLYAEVLTHAHRYCTERYPVSLGVTVDASAAERLEAFVRAFLHRLLDAGRPAWHGKLMAMEMADPSPALDTLVTLSIQPMFVELRQIVGELLGAAAGEDVVNQCAGSIVGQCLHYKHARPVIVRMGMWRIDGPDDVVALARHITRFSLGGIAAIRGGETASA